MLHACVEDAVEEWNEDVSVEGNGKVTGFNSVLVANRGEIAVRVIRSVKARGLRAIAVYSEADVDAPHVRAADEAVLIGPAPVAESYLDAGRILKAARSSGAQAIHPGYGFFSENAAFARACVEAGLVFIGPPADAIDLMGNKAEAKRRMIEAGVPCVPGYEGEDQATEVFVRCAAQIGYPVMVKAAAGGGGRGMRLVAGEGELPGAIELARAEARSAFGSGQLILEKAIIRPRHVEIQVFADAHGNVIHLGERDCSVQRRHQKVVEESPCPVLTDELRESMGQAAVEAARKIDYRGAGTVEFLLDDAGEFYFLEMNTRLQVEHPVTEMVTGLDLVTMQIDVAAGKPLWVSQEDVSMFGHAIEVRLYAEDPAQGFLPATGTIEVWQAPEGEGVRVDAGIASGQEVSPFYDPMLAKIVAWGDDRDAARRCLIAALENTVLFGPTTNRDFLIDVLSRETFARGEATTAFIAEEYGSEGPTALPVPAYANAAAAVLQCVAARTRAASACVSVAPALLNWSSSGYLASRVCYDAGHPEAEILVTPVCGDRYTTTMGADTTEVVVESIEGLRAVLTLGGVRHTVYFHEPAPGQVRLAMLGRTFALADAYSVAASAEEEAGGGHVAAPMHGMLIELAVGLGDKVVPGTRLAVLEAMKMQHEILAEIEGTVADVFEQAGTQVAADDPLMRIEPVANLESAPDPMAVKQ